MKKITLLLPSSGINYLWQLGAVQALTHLGLDQKVESIVACSGGAWTSCFLGLGKDALDDWARRAPLFYVSWQKQNRFSYLRRMTCALKDDSREVLHRYGFFNEFKPPFRFHIKTVQVYPAIQVQLLDMQGRTPQYIHRAVIASSTIPFVTGTVARLEGRMHVDGGFLRGMHAGYVDEKSKANTLVLLDPHHGLQVPGTITLRPSKIVKSGLRLGSPLPISQKELEWTILDGYRTIMMNRSTILQDLQETAYRRMPDTCRG